MFASTFTLSFDKIAEKIEDIHKTEHSYIVNKPSQISTSVSDYTVYGLSSLGKTIGFPYGFIEDINASNPALATSIISDRANNYFDNNNPYFCAREFLGKISGIVSNQYAYFDDYQVADIIAASPIANKSFAHAIVTPERLHLRAIDKNASFKINGDDSDLFFCYFIDNSMVGISSFKVQLGIYRLACTNGLILPVKEFVICKQIHRGKKDMVAEFNQTVAFLDERKDEIQTMLTSLSNADATINSMKEEHRADYIARGLNVSKKESVKILSLYSETYGGKSKWDMVNAITEFARDIENLERREYLERKALKVA